MDGWMNGGPTVAHAHPGLLLSAALTPPAARPRLLPGGRRSGTAARWVPADGAAAPPECLSVTPRE